VDQAPTPEAAPLTFAPEPIKRAPHGKRARHQARRSR
jgi:hypothetical protein